MAFLISPFRLGLSVMPNTLPSLTTPQSLTTHRALTTPPSLTTRLALTI